MESEPNLLHSWVVTAWPKVFEGRGEGEAAQQARHELLVRYHEVVYHYFLKKLHNPHAAQELYSNFALRLLESDALLKRADPERGRFRAYLKTALHNMVIDYYRRQGQGPHIGPLPPDVTAGQVPDEDRDFQPLWRQELLNQAWKALEQSEKGGQSIGFAVLRYQSDHPEERSPQIAEQLTQRLGRPITSDAVRTALHRAREKFAALLMAEVERSLQNPTLDQLEQELIDFKLLPYCKKALEQRRQAEQ
jgi:RNA polymerase sigma factor (sigma-70 family)